ncbi:MAG: cation:proton antiporter [Nanoarchaeota archaeon]
METVFIQLAIILLVAFIVSYIARAFKQPAIVGYIIAGMIISPFVFKFGASLEITNFFSKLGVAFLLFIVGLHMNPKIIKEVGVFSLVIGLVQMIVTFLIGLALSFYVLHFNLITSSYIGIALAFSSTIIVLKLLSDRRQLESLYGKISIGILLTQDLVAIIILMFISSESSGISLGSFALKGLLGGGALIVVLFLLGFTILPVLVKNIARNQELLFLFSIMWAFVIAGLFNFIGFSLEIGALLAGVVLSISPYSIEISSKVRPLRDFFLIIFFIILGLNIQLSSLSSIITNALILSVIALVFKPIIIMTLMAMTGYTKRTNFLVGTALGQISEFSLIILALGVSFGQISSEVLSTITLTGIITITVSTYMILYSDAFYNSMYKFASLFEKKGVKRETKIKREYNAILFGYNRIGFSILKSLKSMKKSYLVVDYDPDTISNLNKLGVPALYGDVGDEGLLSDLPLDKLQLAVSTVPEVETNEILVRAVKEANPSAVVILRAHTIEDAMRLYQEGADYVLTPHFLGGEYLAEMIKDTKVDTDDYKKEREKHIKMLKERFARGQEHPFIEKD